MIVFDLVCKTAGHRFEGWFGSSDDFSNQSQRGLVVCPQCGDEDVVKAPMAPAVPRKGNQLDVARKTPAEPQPQVVSMPPEAAKIMEALATMQAEVLKGSRWVGESFAEQSRAMHYGEKDAEVIHGKATPAEAKALADEGIAVAPLPFPIVPPEEAN